MKKIEDLYKDRFNNLIISEEDLKNIKNNIVKKYKKVKIRKKVFLCCTSILLISIVGFGIVYAEEIEDFVKGFTIQKKVDEKGQTYIKGQTTIIKEMNYDANIPEISRNEKGNTYSLSELENILGIKVLKSKYYATDQFLQEYTHKVDGKISSASFKLKDFTNSKKEEDKIADKYDMSFGFTTKYAADNVAKWNMSPGVEKKEYYVKKLNTTAYILKMSEHQGNGIKYYIVTFNYDNVNYIFTLLLERKTIEEAEQQTKDLLDSLNY